MTEDFLSEPIIPDIQKDKLECHEVLENMIQKGFYNAKIEVKTRLGTFSVYTTQQCHNINCRIIEQFKNSF